MPRQNTSLRKILDAAGEEFSSKGYHHTSMDNIARSAGVAKGTLYYNFPTKAELFKAVVSDGIEFMMRAISAEIDQDKAALEQVESIIRFHVDMFIQYPHIVKIMFNELSGGLEEGVQKYVGELRERYEDFFIDLLELGIREGVVKNLDRQLLARTLLDLLYSTVNYAVDRGRQVDKNAIYEFLRVLLFEGVFTGGES